MAKKVDQQEPKEATSLEIQSVLHKFEMLFQDPKSLPPPRKQDHTILVEGMELVRVRPYRYPHIQKNEIKKLVAEMLVVDIVRPNTSPFSSPVLLVKKKDGS